MSDLRDAVVDAATSSVSAEPETRLAARQQVACLLASAGNESGEAAHQALRRWEAVDRRKRKIARAMALWTVVAIVSAAVLWFNIQDFLWYKRSIYSEGLLQEARAVYRDRGLTEEQLLLLFGEPVESGNLFPGRQAPWQLHPKDPALFSEYALAWQGQKGQLPADFAGTAAGLDPDNAFFRYVEASVTGKKSVKRNSLSARDRKAGKPPTWTVVDEQTLDAALAIASSAKDLGRFETYEHEMALRRLSLLGKGGGSKELGYRRVSLWYAPNASLTLQSLFSCYAAKAQQLAAQGDREQFLRLLASLEAFTETTARNSRSALDSLVIRAGISTAYPALERAARELGFDQEALRLEQIHRKFKESNDLRIRRSASTPFENRGGILSNLFFESLHRMTENPPLVTPRKLMPGSYHDHALASRASAVAAWAVLGLSVAMIAVGRRVTPLLVTGLAARITALLTLMDYLWIIGMGIVVPMLSVLAFSRLTPFGCREFSVIGGTKWLLPAADFLGMVLGMLAATALVAGWRIRRRTIVFDLGKGMPWLAMLALLSAGGGMFLTGYIVSRQQWGPSIPHIAAAPFAASLLLLLGMAVQGHFGSLRQRLHNVTIAGVLIPVTGCAMLIMIALTPLFAWEADYWLDRFDFIKTDEASAPMTAYEGELGATLRKETLTMLGAEP